MRIRHKIVLASIGLGLLMWLIDGLLDYLIFYPGSLLGLLILDVPEHEIWVRLFTLASFVAFGLIAAATVERQEKAERRAKRAARSLRMLSDCNQVLIRADEESQLLEDVCRVIVDVGRYRLAWVSLASEDEPEGVRVVAKAGEEGGRLARLEEIQAGDDPGSSAALRAIRRGAPVTVGDLPAAPVSATRHPGRRRDGHGAVIALPLKGPEGTLAALSVYADEQERFGTQETRVLAELASDLAFGIQTLRGRVEGRRAEEALRKSKSLLDRTGRMARVGGWELDAETLAVSWTEETYRIHEVPLDYEPPLDEAIDFFHPDDQDRLSQAIERALEEGEPFDLELRFITAKGNHLWTRALCEPHVVDGETVKLVGVFQDITARKRAEEALRKERDRVQQYLDIAGVMIVALDASGEVTLVNRKGCEILGYDEGKLVGQNWFDTCLPESGRDEVKRLFQRLMAGEAEPVERYENSVVTSEGEERLIAWHNTLLTDDDGTVVGTLSSGTDITERKRAEEALEQYTEQLETLREIDQAILAADSPGEIAAAALHRLRRLIPCLGAGVALYDFEGQQVELLAVDADAEGPVEQGTVLPLVGLEEAIEKSQRGEVFVERDLQRLDEPAPAMRVLEAAGVGSFIGVPLLAHEYLRGVLGLASASRGAFSEEQIAIAADIADQLAIAIEHARLYEELQDQSAELERRVAERTAELRDRMAEVEELNQALGETLGDLEETNRQLDQKADELQAANAELEAFAYSVSHDLRAPLRAINGFAQIIARRHRDSLDEEGRRYFDNVVEASQHMGELIDDLLRFSRLGRQAVRLRPVALDDIFARVLSDLAGRIAEEHAEVILPDDLPTIEGSPTLLAQIFTNLMDNALTYHRPDVPPRVEVGWKAKADSIVVSVADEGIGIAAEFHEKIFRIFQRLHSQDEFRGTGIGLAMVRKAADRLGGRVWVESAEGAGSTFYVRLPMNREE